MAVALKYEYSSDRDTHQEEIRKMVLAGLQEVSEGETKDFDAVCDRLVKKYEDAAV